MDTVIMLNKPDGQIDGGCIELRFTKARLRKRHDDLDFANIKIARHENGWQKVGDALPKPGKAASERDQMKHFFIDVYDHLADGVTASPGHDGRPVRKVKVDRIRDEMKPRGYLDIDDRQSITGASRKLLCDAKKDLMSSRILAEMGGLIWRIGKGSR
jgi:hypothetical protein